MSVEDDLKKTRAYKEMCAYYYSFDATGDAGNAVTATRHDDGGHFGRGDGALQLELPPVVRTGQKAVPLEDAPVELHVETLAQERDAAQRQRPVEGAGRGDHAHDGAGPERRGNHERRQALSS